MRTTFLSVLMVLGSIGLASELYTTYSSTATPLQTTYQAPSQTAPHRGSGRREARNGNWQVQPNSVFAHRGSGRREAQLKSPQPVFEAVHRGSGRRGDQPPVG